jgi:hypothetical protein
MAAPQPMPLEEIEKHFKPPPAAVNGGAAASPPTQPISPLDLSDLSDLEPVELPFRFGGKSYLLREASEAAIIKWRSTLFHDAKFVDGKPTNLEELAPMNSLLVSLCTFEAETGKPVSVETVRAWSARLVSRLYETARNISGLDVEETTARGGGEEAPLAPPTGEAQPTKPRHDTRTMWGE